MGSTMNLVVLSFSCLLALCCSYNETSDFYTYSSLNISSTKLKPFDWRYLRVDLPPWFSSLSIAIDTDVNLDKQSIEKNGKSSLPMICFRDGGFPLPDVTKSSLKGLVVNHFNGSTGFMQYFQNVEQCYALQANMTLTWTYDQVMPGAFYVGLFNGIGPLRTQSRMINRGSMYTFTANVTVEACSTLWGQYCNQTVDEYSCNRSDIHKLQQNYQEAMINDQKVEHMVSCRNFSKASCHGNTESKFYSFDVLEVTEQLVIKAEDAIFNQTFSTNKTWNSSGIILMCYARYGAIPKKTLHDYSGNIGKDPLVIQSPRVGTWYFTIQLEYQANASNGTEGKYMKTCYLMEWQAYKCPHRKGGANCLWEKYKLNAVPRDNPMVPLVYLPDHHENVSLEYPNFSLKPLLSKASNGSKSVAAWTYFTLDVPQTGKNIHIQLLSDRRINYELYARVGGLPSLDMWDYSYTNKTGRSKSDSMFKLYNPVEERINFNIIYAREGLWVIGLRHLVYTAGSLVPNTTISISIKSCINGCSGHGKCQSQMDASGSTDYSYCACDRARGGFDCGVKLVSPEGHGWHSVALIASNAAALLPAFWALQQKAVSECIIFISSGVSSGFYHACDVGSWCALPFHVLQFMDFWLSFMAVVSTFLYLTVISEAAKRAIQTTVSIITALMAITGPTRSSNIVLVMAIGAVGLLAGWLIEFHAAHKLFSVSLGFCLNILERWQDVKIRFFNLMKMLHKRFHWGFVLMGFIALTLAAASFKLDHSHCYWFWHSLWHITIYTSALFFLCSKAAALGGDNQVLPDTVLELTQQHLL